MKAFNKWWFEQQEQNEKIDLQFTELTKGDIATHEDLYTTACLALHFEFLPAEHFDDYFTYAEQELQKANASWLKTFG